jgi:hypothetical protein
MKVTLRKRLLKTGKISLYLDHCPPIIHPESGKMTRWEYLEMYLYSPPSGKNAEIDPLSSE